MMWLWIGLALAVLGPWLTYTAWWLTQVRVFKFTRLEESKWLEHQDAMFLLGNHTTVCRSSEKFWLIVNDRFEGVRVPGMCRHFISRRSLLWFVRRGGWRAILAIVEDYLCWHWLGEKLDRKQDTPRYKLHPMKIESGDYSA